MRLVWLTLAAQVVPAHVEATYLLQTGAQLHPAVMATGSDALAESFIQRSFATVQEMLYVKTPGDIPRLRCPVMSPARLCVFECI